MESNKGFFFVAHMAYSHGGGDATYKSGMTFKAPQLTSLWRQVGGSHNYRDHGKLRYRHGGARVPYFSGMIFFGTIMVDSPENCP